MRDLRAMSPGFVALSVLAAGPAAAQVPPDCDPPPATSYEVVPLTGLVPGTFSPAAINAPGAVAGVIFGQGGGPGRVFVWEDGALAIRALEGQSLNVAGLTSDGRVAGSIDRGDGAGATVFVWSSRTDELVMIPTPVPVFPEDVNDDLLIVGGDLDGLFGFALDGTSGRIETIAFGEVPRQGVGTLGAAAVNGAGLVVGSEVVFLPEQGFFQETPYTWTAAGGIVELPGFEPDGFGGRASAVNGRGDVAGHVLDDFFGRQFALWPAGGGGPITFLALPSLTPLVATAINHAGRIAVVGDNDLFGYTRGLVWHEGEITDLSCFTLETLGLLVLWPVDMNEAGELVVLLGDADGKVILDVVVLRPVDPAPGADLDGDGDVDVDDLVQLILAWGPCPPRACPADLDGDGHVAVDDLVILILSWT